MKGLSSASKALRVSVASCNRTPGVFTAGSGAGILFLVLFTDLGALSCSVSVVSASDMAGAFVLLRVLGVFDLRDVLGVASTSSWTS